VDFTVMITFLEFYCTLLQFVLFKMYHNLGLRSVLVDSSMTPSCAQDMARE
jgi:hypothetical protein